MRTASTYFSILPVILRVIGYPMFARKPTPLSVTWAGYVGTTGLAAIDYLLADRFVSVDEEQFYSEKILRMPDSWTTYTPPPYAPACTPLPAYNNGFITFGSFSNPRKINGSTIDLWAKILRAVPNAVLILKYNAMDSPHQVRRIAALFAANGIGKERFILEGGASHADFIARYADIDLALDTFPYSGGLTTYEALWMGVPVVAKNGATFASRHALGILQAVGFRTSRWRWVGISRQGCFFGHQLGSLGVDARRAQNPSGGVTGLRPCGFCRASHRSYALDMAPVLR